MIYYRDSFKKRTKPGLLETKFRFTLALCGDDGRYCMVIGGRKKAEDKPIGTVERYDIGNEDVVRMPDLNVPRSYLSACSAQNASS